MSLLDHSPRRLTYDDYLLLPEDGLRHEIVDGVHVVNPAPDQAHQRLVGFVYFQLIEGVERAGLGSVMLSPFDVRLGDHDIVQPDVMAIARAAQERLHGPYLFGAPTLAVEVLSPSTARMDRGAKLQAYDRAGVEEYWILDPKRRVAERWSRVGEGRSAEDEADEPGGSTSSFGSDLGRVSGGLQPDGEFEDELPSSSFPGVSVALDEAWRQMIVGSADAG